MKKILLIAAASFAALSLAANPLNGWIPTNSDLKAKNPDMIKTDAASITLSGIPKMSWFYFKASPAVKVKKGQQVEITITASGKGKVELGFYEYVAGFSVSHLNVKKIDLTDKAAEQKIILNVKDARTTIARPVIRIAPDGQIVVTKYAIKALEAAK